MGFLGAIPVAGPVSALVLHCGLKMQFSRGIALAAGAAMAEGIYVALAFFGFNLFLVAIPQFDLISKWVTSLILIGLGLYFIFQKHTKTSKVESNRIQGEKRGSFFFGFTVSVLNPTLIITWTTVIASIHAYHWFEYGMINAISFSTGVAIGIWSWFVLMLLIIRKAHSYLQDRQIRRILTALGVGLVFFGLFGIWRSIQLY